MDHTLKYSPEEREALDEFIEEFARLAQYSENQNENAKWDSNFYFKKWAIQNAFFWKCISG